MRKRDQFATMSGRAASGPSFFPAGDNGKSASFQCVGWVERQRNPSIISAGGPYDGFRFALPILRTINPKSPMTPLGQIRQIDYTVIFVRDMEAMRRFYGTVME